MIFILTLEQAASKSLLSIKTKGQAEAIIRPPIQNWVESTLHWKTDFK